MVATATNSYLSLPSSAFSNAGKVGHVYGPNVPQRFWTKVAVGKTDECWKFLASRDARGYGRFRVDANVVLYAHIIAYELVYGPVPELREVCHSCGNKSCCNYHHLYAGTHVDNAGDAVAAGVYVRGETHWKATLTDERMRQAVDEYLRGVVRQCDVAAKYGIQQSTLSRWITGARRG